MEPDRGLIAYEEPPPESTDLLSSAWCSSAIQVLQTGPKECSMALVEHPVMALGNDRNDLLSKSNRSLVVDNSSFSTTQWKYDDLKSWIWLQKAIHPELDYDLCLKKKWLPRKMAPWNGISLKKWVKERKQKRKEEARLQRAEVHAAVSVAGVAAALAAIAAENVVPRGAAGMRETAVASAAALVAAQCAKVAEAAGATRDQLAAAVDAARASTDASNVITLTAAAATSLRGAATLRGRRSSCGGGGGRNGQNERADHAGSTAALSQDDLDFDFNHARSRAALAKGEEMFVAMPDGKWKLHTVSAASNKRGEIVLRIKKTNLVMAFSHAKESVIRDVRPCAPEKPSPDEGATYPIEVSTSKGKVELRADDYGVYKRWVATLSHMLVMSTAVSVS
ncbi:hypothetical protein BS78_06G148700 [Paspalum vaginatum]|nr:hypothetical protein BS78_06G148700 [Paspalum vaginatum]KAJ1271732.1 hypothetical protein BS78_06G148700 [Paspalum vaginatum]KAJ1271733.1 hypothetical protein BS78_06G148700 [Paspalum vaginatum]